MILKELTYPMQAKKYEALLRRLPHTHPKRKLIEAELGKILAGYRGEKSLNYYLSFLPKDKCFILHDLRIPSSQNQYFFQMDLLILNQAFFLIIEVKNIAGIITYDPEFQQLIRTHENKESAFQDPILQVQRQKQQFQYWLSKQNLMHPIPILTTVILSNPQTIIKKTSNQSASDYPIIRPDKLPSIVSEQIKSYNQPLISAKEIKKLAKNLISEHEENNDNLLNKHQLLYHDLIKGVHCPNCFSIPMNQKRYYWFCPHCSHSDSVAHKYSINDYLLLVHSTITNSQVRDFLQIPSRYTAQRLLQTANLLRNGTNKGSFYQKQ